MSEKTFSTFTLPDGTKVEVKDKRARAGYESLLEDKLDKYTIPDGIAKVYGANIEGKQTTYPLKSENEANSIVMRDGYNNFQVGNASFNGLGPFSAVPKAYVDNAVKGAKDYVDEKTASAGGGGSVYCHKYFCGVSENGHLTFTKYSSSNQRVTQLTDEVYNWVYPIFALYTLYNVDEDVEEYYMCCITDGSYNDESESVSFTVLLPDRTEKYLTVMSVNDTVSQI